MFAGYKTYIVAFTTIVGAVGLYLAGDATLADTLQVVIPAILAATVRHGIANG